MNPCAVMLGTLGIHVQVVSCFTWIHRAAHPLGRGVSTWLDFMCSPRLEIPLAAIKLSFCPLRGGQQCPGCQRLCLCPSPWPAGSLKRNTILPERSQDSIPVLNSCFSISSSELQSLLSSIQPPSAPPGSGLPQS